MNLYINEYSHRDSRPHHGTPGINLEQFEPESKQSSKGFCRLKW